MKTFRQALFGSLLLVVGGCAADIDEELLDYDEEEVDTSSDAVSAECGTKQNACTIFCGNAGYKFSKGVKSCAGNKDRGNCVCSNKSGRPAVKGRAPGSNSSTSKSSQPATNESKRRGTGGRF